MPPPLAVSMLGEGFGLLMGLLRALGFAEPNPDGPVGLD